MQYGDPAPGRESDVQVAQVQGVSGGFCIPRCAVGSCPSDAPATGRESDERAVQVQSTAWADINLDEGGAGLWADFPVA